MVHLLFRQNTEDMRTVMQSTRLRQKQEGISSSSSSSRSLWIPDITNTVIIIITWVLLSSLTQLISHIVESIILLLNLLALHPVDDDVRGIVCPLGDVHHDPGPLIRDWHGASAVASSNQPIIAIFIEKCNWVVNNEFHSANSFLWLCWHCHCISIWTSEKDFEETFISSMFFYSPALIKIIVNDLCGQLLTAGFYLLSINQWHNILMRERKEINRK